jgi:hypothetical protein
MGAGTARAVPTRRITTYLKRGALLLCGPPVHVRHGEKLSDHDGASSFWNYPSDLLVTSVESGLPQDTVFLGVQVRSIEARRLGQKAGQLPAHRLVEAFDALRQVMGDDRRLAEPW